MSVLEPIARPPAVAPPADWRAVRRVTVGVCLRYRYDYAAPIADLRQRLVVVPPARHGDQRLVAHELAVTGADAVVACEEDAFGNRVHRVAAAAVRAGVEFTATFTVERRAHAAAPFLPAVAARAAYLPPTALTAPDDRIRDAAAAIAATVDADDAAAPRALADAAANWAAGAIAYAPGATGVRTPAAMALHLGLGVCQDYAHLALAMLRALGIPARYVSGHLLGEGAPHAWCEALVPDPRVPDRLRAIAYDPTHRRRAGLDHVTVAVGRDYADVAPTSGTFTGAAGGALTALKDAWLVDVEEGTR